MGARGDKGRTHAPLQDLRFFITPAHACSYLPDRDAVTLFGDPAAPLDNTQYTLLSELGFRRSGEHIYRPHCPGCRACIPVRIPVAEFQPDRSQARTWRRNNDLRVSGQPAHYRAEHFELYQRYIRSRHPGGEMDDGDPRSYWRFVNAEWSDTWLYEFREGNRLVGVAVADRLHNGLSAVYTFFDPDLSKRALGVYAVLWEIEEARRLGLQWVYLGYWIRECRKMAYKDRYRPLECFLGQGWQRLPNL